MSVIRDDRCTFTFNRIAPGTLELFVDAARASMPAVSVSKLYEARKTAAVRR